MDQIAVINIKNGEVNPHGDRTLSDEDIARIETWMAERTALLAQRDIDDIHRAVDYLNITTQWVQSKAKDDQLEDITDDVLLAMHDLRSILVRKKADRLMKAQDAAEQSAGAAFFVSKILIFGPQGRQNYIILAPPPAAGAGVLM